MKKCSDCNVDMIDNCVLEGDIPFVMGAEGRAEMKLHVPTGETEKFLGMKINKHNIYYVKARVCPKCGKIEIYVETKEN